MDVLIGDQVRHGHVLYGGYTFTILIRGVRPQVAVMDACVNQRNTRLYDAKTNKPVRLQYTPYRPGGRWRVVSGYKRSRVAACPG